MKYFTIKELCKSSTANKLGINNNPSKNIITNLEALVDYILDPLREEYGNPIMVNSGYRCNELNKAVKGSKNSAHLYGLAADITTGSTNKNKILFNLIQTLDLPFD